MAVEARNLNLFPSQFLQARELTNPMNQNGVNTYNSQQMCFLGIPSATALPENQTAMCDSVAAKTSVNTDSGLTYNTRKRPRDSFNQLYAAPPYIPAPQKSNTVTQSPFAGDEILLQIHQYHQFEIDAIISQHTKRIRLELESKQKQQARLLTAAIGEGVMRKLKEKDEQIQRMSKLNLVLQERVKSLYVENQLWRDLAQTNEATANSLRSNLEQVLLHVGGDEHVSAAAGVAAAAVEEDVESCCGSSDHGENNDGGSSCYSDRRCKICGERESSVLLLPCRHLCLCNVCGGGSQLQTCPVCNSSMTATLHVNMSS